MCYQLFDIYKYIYSNFCIYSIIENEEDDNNNTYNKTDLDIETSQLNNEMNSEIYKQNDENKIYTAFYMEDFPYIVINPKYIVEKEY